MIAVETIDLSKRYLDGDRRLLAVEKVSISIGTRELAMVRGPSGSGKTTLLGLIGGMIAPTSGDIRIEGESIVHLREGHRALLRRRQVGFVFQELALAAGMTLLENLLLPLVPDGGASAADRKRAMSLLERFGLAARKDTRASALSGGERQRGAIARALIRDPQLLLLDEPTAHLDAANAGELLSALITLRDEGKTIVCATHDARLADDPRVDRTLQMADGKLIL